MTAFSLDDCVSMTCEFDGADMPSEAKKMEQIIDINLLD